MHPAELAVKETAAIIKSGFFSINFLWLMWVATCFVLATGCVTEFKSLVDSGEAQDDTSPHKGEPEETEGIDTDSSRRNEIDPPEHVNGNLGVGADTDGGSSDSSNESEPDTGEHSRSKIGNDLGAGGFFGYQCWHFAKGDGRIDHPDIRDDPWVHWFDDDNEGSFEQVHGDFWPDFSDYEAAGVPLYDTQMRYPNGEPVKVYSCWDYETVDLHIKWVAEYGLKGVFFQRQALNINNSRSRALFDRVALHVWRACEKYNVKFAMMPCNNYIEMPGDDTVAKRELVKENIINDWKYIVDELRVPGRPGYRMIDSPMYAYQKNRQGIPRPVMGLWGLGWDNRPMTPGDAREIISAFHNDDEYSAYVMGGLTHDWRSDPKSAEWLELYKELDMVSPWRVIFAIKTSDDVRSTMREDLEYCYDNGLDYNPVISAGASTRHKLGEVEKRNWKPRYTGQHMWNQALELERGWGALEQSRGLAPGSLPRFLYLAMLDEIDEGTALYKQAESQGNLPVNDTNDQTLNLVALDEDGTTVSADFYLRLSKATQDLLFGSMAPTQDVPIPAR